MQTKPSKAVAKLCAGSIPLRWADIPGKDWLPTVCRQKALPGSCSEADFAGMAIPHWANLLHKGWLAVV